MMKSLADNTLEVNRSSPCNRSAPWELLSSFVVAVFGFSFWFFMAVPFASHRETYWWLGMVRPETFVRSFGFISVTYRPLAQVATWLGFLILDPSVFPTSVLHQTFLQGFVYAMFVLGWWLIYKAVTERRLFAGIAFIAGGAFFSGYVHLFHIYGLFYVPVMLTIGALLRLRAAGTFGRREVGFAIVAIALALWHPFATALFLGFYFGFYIETFRDRSIMQHIRAVVILLAGALAIALFVVTFHRPEIMSLDTRLHGFLVSYRTNEVNLVASLVAFLLAQMVVLSMGLGARMRLGAILFVSAVGAVFLLTGLPLLLLWVGLVLIKLVRLRCWSLCFLALAAALLPLGGAIGTPTYALFAIVVGVYVTALEWPRAESVLSVVRTGYVIGGLGVLLAVLLMVRMGMDVPIVTSVAKPLLMERERTYQLEKILAWQHDSEYCGYEISFAEDAGSPVYSLESAMLRRNRPPAALEDVRILWDNVLRCRNTGAFNYKTETSIVTFSGSPLVGLRPVFRVEGRYAGDATVWIEDSRK
jgi:hypothetical protein